MAVNCGSIPSATDLVDAIEGSDLFDSNEQDEAAERITSEELEEYDDEEYEVGITTTTAVAADRYFMGTFEHAYSYKQCPNWPVITRMYSYDDRIDIEDNKGDLVTQGAIFIDDTFSLNTTYLDDFGRPLIDLTCTCVMDTSVYYDDRMECQCSYGSSSCTVAYEIFSGTS
jgi:hypothetical protein